MKINLFETLSRDVQKLIIRYLDPINAYQFALLKNDLQKKDFLRIQIRYVAETLNLRENFFRKISYEKVFHDGRNYIICPFCKSRLMKWNKGSHQRKCGFSNHFESCDCCNTLNMQFATGFSHLVMKRKYYCPFQNIWNCPNCIGFKNRTLDQVIYHFYTKCIRDRLSRIAYRSPNVLLVNCSNIPYVHFPHAPHAPHAPHVLGAHRAHGRDILPKNFYPIICSVFAAPITGYIIYKLFCKVL